MSLRNFDTSQTIVISAPSNDMMDTRPMIDALSKIASDHVNHIKSLPASVTGHGFVLPWWRDLDALSPSERCLVCENQSADAVFKDWLFDQIAGGTAFQPHETIEDGEAE